MKTKTRKIYVTTNRAIIHSHLGKDCIGSFQVLKKKKKVTEDKEENQTLEVSTPHAI